MVFLVSSVPTVNHFEIAFPVSRLLWKLVHWWTEWQPPREKTKQKNVWFLTLVLLVGTPLYVELVFQVS